MSNLLRILFFFFFFCEVATSVARVPTLLVCLPYSCSRTPSVRDTSQITHAHPAKIKGFAELQAILVEHPVHVAGRQ